MVIQLNVLYDNNPYQGTIMNGYEQQAGYGGLDLGSNMGNPYADVNMGNTFGSQG